MKNILEQLRSDKSITQEELAKKLEVTRQTIISIEKGRYNPSLMLAFKISDFFNLPIHEIFLYKEDNHV